MPGSFGFTPQSQQLAFDAIAVRVYWVPAPGPDAEDDEGDDDPVLLPNVRCEQIQYKEGVEPPSARFSYILDDLAASMNGWPAQFEQIWPLTTPPSDYVAATDDELIVRGLMPDGTTRTLFHGFARVPQVDLSPEHQSVTFVAVGVAIRCWDTPIAGSVWRHGDSPSESDPDFQIQTDLPCRFDPAGTGTRAIGGYLPNCTPDGTDVGQGMDNAAGVEEPYPVFIEPNLDLAIGGDTSGTTDDIDLRTFWNLSKVARYILARHNIAKNAAGDLWITNPDFTEMDTLLQNRRPLKGAQTFDPTKPSTYQTDDNQIRDYDASNKPWPEVMAQLLGFYGFGMRWACMDDQNGDPLNTIEFYRKDASAPNAPKQVNLPTSGTAITDALCNLANFHAAYDYHGVANAFMIETGLERYEISVILAPGYKPKAGDELPPTSTSFLLSALNANNAEPDQRKKYRYYIADECDDGHWSIQHQAWTTGQPINLTPVFELDASKDSSSSAEDTADGKAADATYVRRYRPGKQQLFSKDPSNRPRKCQLAISRNYGIAMGNNPAGADPPCLWDGVAGTDWQEIPKGWEPLKDRLGVLVTADDPQSWAFGKVVAGDPPVAVPQPRAVVPPPDPPMPPAGPAPGVLWPCPDGKFQGITCFSNPADPNGAPPVPAGQTQVWLRFTTVIDGDYGIESEGPRRDASPLKNSVYRVVDAKDHFKYDVIDVSSAFADVSKFPKDSSDGQNPNQLVVQDDDDQATAHACQLRSAHEFPPLTCAITIPSFSTSVVVGDRISKIAGREVSLRVNAGAEQSEPASYPFVVAVTWDFTGEKQSTVLQLSDRRAEPRAPQGHYA